MGDDNSGSDSGSQQPNAETQGPQGPQVRLRPPYIFGAFVLAGLVLTWLLPWPLLPESWGLGRWPGLIAGLGLGGAGFALAAWGLTALETGGATHKFSTPTPRIIISGPYRFSRNPIYISLLLLYGGGALVLNSFWVVILLPLFPATLTHVVVKNEERFLEGRFGAEYSEYKSRVRRWL